MNGQRRNIMKRTVREINEKEKGKENEEEGEGGQ